MLLSLDRNRTFLVELLESIRGIRLYNLMLNFVELLLNFVCVTVCNDAGKHFGQWQLF